MAHRRTSAQVRGAQGDIQVMEVRELVWERRVSQAVAGPVVVVHQAIRIFNVAITREVPERAVVESVYLDQAATEREVFALAL